MGVEDKNRNEILSRISVDLFVKSKGGEELSAKIHRLRDEIKKVIESEETIFGKFRALVKSFEEIIPEEKQRYNAAIKALSATSKISRQEIVKAVNNQLGELKIIEKGIMPALPWRDELKVMEAKSREMRDEISKLHEKIERLENEEKGILDSMAGREKEMELVEKAVRELFMEIGGEIADIKKRMEELSAESAAPQPIPSGDPVKSYSSGEEEGGGKQKSEISEPSAPQDSEWQKKCPMCGGQMNFQIKDEMWICYSCAYEELKKNEVEGNSEQTNARKPTLATESIFDPSPSLEEPSAPLFPDEVRKTKKGSSSSNSQPSGKKKSCPVCHKKMDWYESEKAWRCPFCDYERSI